MFLSANPLHLPDLELPSSGPGTTESGPGAAGPGLAASGTPEVSGSKPGSSRTLSKSSRPCSGKCWTWSRNSQTKSGNFRNWSGSSGRCRTWSRSSRTRSHTNPQSLRIKFVVICVCGVAFCNAETRSSVAVAARIEVAITAAVATTAAVTTAAVTTAAAATGGLSREDISGFCSWQ